MRVLADQGIADRAMMPDLAQPGSGTAEPREVTLTVRPIAAKP